MQSIGQAETINSSRMTNIFTKIMRMGRSFLSMMKVISIYAGAFEDLYGAPLTETSIEDTVNNMIPIRYLPKQSVHLTSAT